MFVKAGEKIIFIKLSNQIYIYLFLFFNTFKYSMNTVGQKDKRVVFLWENKASKKQKRILDQIDII